MQKLIDAAKEYTKRNISVVATDDNKRALFQWKEFQSRIITDEEIEKQFSHFKCAGIAVICGEVSGNLEVIDIDCKNDLSGKLYENICDNIPEELFKKLKIVRTKSLGYHFYYRCEIIEGNQKFAMRLPTAEELKETPHLKQIVLVESRGESGYVIAPPTVNYTTIQQKPIPTITTDERDILLEICRSFNEVVEEKIITPKERTGFGVKPWDDFNVKADVIGMLVKHGWSVVSQTGERTFLKRPGKTESKTSGDYHSGLNLFKAFTTSSEFEPGKAYTPFGVYCLLEHGGDPSKAAKQLIKDGYGEPAQVVEKKTGRTIRTLRDGGYNNDQIKEKLKKDHNLSDTEADGVIKDYSQQAGEIIATFWSVDEKGKINISRNKLERFLKNKGGFMLYFYNEKSSIYRIIKSMDGFVEETSPERIKKFIKNYIYSLEPSEPFDHGTTVEKLMETVLRGADAYFNKGFLEFLDEGKFDFLKDNQHTAYFPLRNGVVCVSKKDIILKSYGDINKVIWKSQVIDAHITIDNNFESSLCEFHKFIYLISGGDTDRTNYCLSLIGYLLHKHKDSARPWSIILAEETDDEQKGGGTGKGILVKAISHMVNCERVDGKNFKLDKNFAFQRVGLDTKIVAIEDVRRNVDFEGFYSIITEGMTVEKKNKDELFIPYQDSPKVLFTTNYTIPSVGVHAKRRQRVFEFAPYFNGKFTPIDEFGHKLFDDWDEDEWNRFYNLMFLCVKQYLSHGVNEPVVSESFKRKGIRVNYTAEFLDFFEDMVKSNTGNWRSFGEEYGAFLSQNAWDKKDYSSKRFKRALVDASEVFSVEIMTQRNKQNGNQHEFKFSSKSDILEEEKTFEF